MSLSRRVSLTPSSPPPPHQDLKHRVITCLHKLSDRDTLSIAAKELESIALTLTDDSFAPFLTYLSVTSSSDKCPVRKQCVRILGVLSAAHGDALAPHLSKMISAVVRRLRDPDSAVRTACVDAVSSMASEITQPPFSSLSKQLVEAVLTEQDYNSQIGSALCLSAAIDASPDPEPAQLQKLLPKILKLIISDSFKAKPALLSVIGSIIGAGGATVNRNSLNSVVPCLVEFLSSEDWGARKAAVEALERLAVAEKTQLTGFKSSCIASLENKRFDKVKVVRETMNRALALWKEVPGHPDEVPVSPQSKCKKSSTGKYSERYLARGSKDPPCSGFETPLKETIPSRKSSPINGWSTTTTPSRSPPKSNCRKQSGPMSRKMMDFNKQTDLKIKVEVPKAIVVEGACKENIKIEKMGVSDTIDSEKYVILETENGVTEQVISNKTKDVKLEKVGASRFGSRVVPYSDDFELDVDINGNASGYIYGNQKEVEDLSLIQKQLVQIGNQQSSLLNLLQKFIGSSRSGMNSLETRVNGLEKALDEMSYDLAISNGRISNADSCCMLPGAEFLSPKFWWKAGGQYSSPRSPFCGGNQSVSDRHSPNKDFDVDTIKMGSPMWQPVSAGGFALNTSGGCFRNLGRSLESLPSSENNNALQLRNLNPGRFDGCSLANGMQQQT